ncbi:MAG TPA: helix-turn-helix transcriptional regulator [Candidatus Alistipes excrementigallinarum]|nr:helix-turn-helix transcriptional regulator [Candidatus Alistipes excrementigallinarum]
MAEPERALRLPAHAACPRRLPLAPRGGRGAAVRPRRRDLAPLCRPAPAPARRPLRADCRRLLCAAPPQLRQQHSPKFYAAELCITEKYLIRAISRATEHTPGYWIANFRLREANVLLRSTDLSVTEIAELLGFGSPSLFARFFRRMTGSAPLSVRRTGRKGE